jgi:dolichyl-phosphate beta-glucosyltransferase
MAGARLSLIVPAYNEANSIARTVTAIQTYCDARGYRQEVIVAADGDDGTREIVGQMAARDRRLSVIGRPGRHGKGKGIREGVARATGEIIGFLDADYKVPIEEMERLLPWLARGYDVAIGSRATQESRVEVAQPLHRRLGSRAFGLCMHCLMGLWDIGDTQCGFKFFTAAVAKDLFARQQIDGYMFDVEILYLARQAGCRIKEVGVRWRDDGDSRLDLVAGNWRNMIDLFRIRFGSRHSLPPTEAQRTAA